MTRVERAMRNYRIGAFGEQEAEQAIVDGLMMEQGMSAHDATNRAKEMLYEDSSPKTEQPEPGSGVDDTGE
jgi:hypothetical protein